MGLGLAIMIVFIHVSGVCDESMCFDLEVFLGVFTGSSLDSEDIIALDSMVWKTYISDVSNLLPGLFLHIQFRVWKRTNNETRYIVYYHENTKINTVTNASPAESAYTVV